MHTVVVDTVKIGPGHPLAIIAGPCVAESAELCLEVGQAMRDRCAQLGLGYIFKASFDKANRSSIHSPRGPGLDDGLAILERVKKELKVPVTTDIHEPSQAAVVASVVDLLQVPAFLCRQTDLLAAAASTGKPVSVKKGQFMSPAEMTNVVTKLLESTDSPPTDTSDREMAGDEQTGGGIILTERGTFFGYHRLVNDFVGLGDLMDLGWPVCFDATHSTQQPGAGQGGSVSGGRSQRAALLARCAVAAGVAAVFLETHPNPDEAISDAATMVPLSQAVALLEGLATLHQAL